MAYRSRQELYDIIKQELQASNSALTDFVEGSILDGLTGALSTGLSEVMDLVITNFNKTFFDLANGPEVTGAADDLQTLAVDHFGSAFARPAATKAVGEVTFSRANDDAGDCTIPAGTVVSTATDSAGNSQSFVTDSEVVMTATSINASVEASTAGIAGNVVADSIIVIDSTLTDPSIIVTNDDAMAGGAAEEDDATYRQTIKNLINQLKGATAAAIESKALTVSGIVFADAIEEKVSVIEYDTANDATVGTYFNIPRSKLYVADANGEANAALVALVQTAIELVRACGVQITVVGATASEVDWTATVTLNPGGPHYATLGTDLSMITDAMETYINSIAIGSGFNKTTANAAMLAMWGPDGSDDITAFSTSIPAASIAGAVGVKLIPGTIELE
jgi:hypothetical protein